MQFHPEDKIQVLFQFSQILFSNAFKIQQNNTRFPFSYKEEDFAHKVGIYDRTHYLDGSQIKKWSGVISEV